jgi:hypothetical protein
LKKIAYIEIDTHAEIAQSFMEIMNGADSFSVDYYFSERIKDQIADNGESIFISDSSMISDQLKSKNYDLIIIGTVHRYFNTFCAIAEKYNTAVIVHNKNFVNIPLLRLFKSIFKADLIYRLKLWWKEGLFYSSKAYQKAKNLLVLDDELSAECFKFLPLFYTKYTEKPDNKVLRIVIPGGVSQQRRNYKKVFSVIKSLENSYNIDIQKKLIEFVFLGKAKDHELRELVNLERYSKYVNITYFSERVSQADFEKWMRKADVLWCPIQQETTFFSQREIYGKTKMTGNLGDAIKFGKPAVFPENYHSHLEFIVAEQSDVIKQFEELKSFNFDFQKDYNKKTVQQKLQKVLGDLISI